MGVSEVRLQGRLEYQVERFCDFTGDPLEFDKPAWLELVDEVLNFSGVRVKFDIGVNHNFINECQFVYQINSDLGLERPAWIFGVLARLPAELFAVQNDGFHVAFNWELFPP